MTLEEKLKDYPEEFTLAMEKAKELQFEDVVDFTIKTYGLESEVEAMKDAEFQALIIFVRQIYNFGFYGGVNFTLDPESFIIDNTEHNEEANK